MKFFISIIATKFWCSLNDFRNPGIYIWAQSATNLYPWKGGVSYANWSPQQPDHSTTDSNCVAAWLQLLQDGMISLACKHLTLFANFNLNFRML